MFLHFPFIMIPAGDSSRRDAVFNPDLINGQRRRCGRGLA